MVLYSVDVNNMSSSVRRLNNLIKVFDYNNKIKPINNIKINNGCTLFCRHKHTGSKITIGDVEKVLKLPKQSEYVPSCYLSRDLSQTTLSNLRWMMQKDNLKQDIFLIGIPGSRRRQLAMSYLELTQQEVEFVSLSRDTTEADLKQRREIINGSAKYINQSAVEAAIEGRVLILEGIEKAERNVLPVLNNLLENREMHLEDGRFLISPDNYDKLLKEFGEEHLKKWNLIRVSDNFRVIALGLPVPGYVGNPLDPPLRSRFQSRDIGLSPFQEFSQELYGAHPEAPRDKLDQLLSCAYTLHSPESKRLNLHDFPLDNLHYAAKILGHNPDVNVSFLFSLLYPYNTVLTKEGKKAVADILRSFKVNGDVAKSYLSVAAKRQLNNEQMVVYLNSNTPLQVNIGTNLPHDNLNTNFVNTSYHEHLLCELVHSHLVTDFCIVGPSGCGKSALIKKFAELMNYEIEPIVLYQDITSRDLIQQRTTLPNGDTVWKNSPLIDAALNGKLALLDGLHRVHLSTLAFLHRLVHDRELQLCDGKRLLRHDRYDALASESGIDRLQEIGILRIHPSFRIIALAESPGNHVTNWLSPELLSLFLYHEMRRLTSKEEEHLINSLYNNVDNRIRSVIGIAEKLRSSADSSLTSVANSLSTRQILRIAKKSTIYSEFDIYDTIQRSCLAKFLPPLTKQALEKILNDADLYSSSVHNDRRRVNKSIKFDDKTVTVGNTVVDRYVTTACSKIPNTLFYDLPQHTDLLEQMLQDFSLGEHLLLVGNQGVGKNKLTDKLLQLLNRPREYIQLHRDTTVHSLTLQPTILDGVVHYEDSPLVKAVSLGHVLVVDEADKAPTHVTCILKILVESGEMILSDGRRIMPRSNRNLLRGKETDRIIEMHPDFRMIVLANRPGFPFLGNNLFAALGDLFSCHIIDNPSPESEKKLLQSYGPQVPLVVIDHIVSAFEELRNLSDKGMVSYPYSTREAVNIVKHLQTYPQDTLSEAVSNVFDFDRYSSEVRDILEKVLRKHEIPVNLIGMKKTEDRDLQMTIERDSGLDVSGPKHGKVDETGNPHVGGNTWAGGTGGRDTAGLGGKGGPYRLDAGHTVHQLSDAEKNAVPEHIQKAAREMGRKAFKERLKEIEMSQYDARLYDDYSCSIQKQVQALRVILSNLQAKSKERQWVRHQTSGELDDMKLIEGITGERGIYRKRADVDPELGAPQTKPKRFRLLVDVSGSMYRFNGHDGRLDREMEAAVMIMEAFYGHKSHILYDIVGHSGEDKNITFVPKDNPPSDNKQRLDVIKLMHAHSQFCWSGDNTLPAIHYSIADMEKEKEDFDEGILIVLSDANLSRYGISPHQLADALQSSDVIRAYAIFIGSLGDQAARLKNSLPPGKGFVCMDLENIPQIIQQIFVSSLFNSN